MSPQPNQSMRATSLVACKNMANVMFAVMLRDMRTRFFNHGLGFMMVPLWPFAHMGIILAIHTAGHRGPPPYGDSAAVFYMTGVLPYLAFSYVSRSMAFSLLTNKAMLAFPIVNVANIVLGRAFLEILAAFVTVFLVTMSLSAIGENPFPIDWEQATEAYLVTLFLAIGCGFFVSVISLMVPFFLTVYQLLIIALYVSSGVFFVASDLPPSISYILSFNPLLVCVDWLRTAFFESYSDKLVDKMFVVSFAAFALLFGLLTDRLLRRRMLEN
ncbi:capsular biosynthesis protein [Rhizobium lusitanum]|uniref:Capsular biosynthesis protein n=1 Tax=Rhizobium lusitanum TaxID=293958 RepID=A0A6L9UCP6_9HYPH|nr:capsular biosynthesis protein [Rhizobium lusitanum]NEI71970.1 capsular biosynthesis protein [Rhizobium lusitanum]